ATSKAVYDHLRQEVALLEENIEDISFGIYKPHYDFDSSEKYKQELDALRAAQRDLIKVGRAGVCAHEWEVRGSKKEGARMQKQYLKVMLRAFNGECDSAIARVRWNNVTKMEERITKAHEAINELGGVMQMSITPQYRDLKLAELRLEYEMEERKHLEAEEQRQIKERMREEEKALREAERAKQEAEEEEERYQKALEKARAELAKAKGEALEELKLKIQHLDTALHKASEMKERANSMAQLTRSGHVYIISNIGSFGETVFKVGMTRRLNPLDRVKELGDASVPFEFDVHAMVYAEDAPALESEFHRFLETRRLNLVNPRKEFFSVTIGELEEFVNQKGLKIELTKLAEAKEYRQSLAMREKASRPQATAAPAEATFPSAI
ncbi:MAG: DUF4041 domain-containing protein, partial [Deltaproteobacteria bacterium]|nr:DUF4041 domain-containing protein [Deltaproteobacteria bacterium]